jgi:hypothetical protein
VYDSRLKVRRDRVMRRLWGAWLTGLLLVACSPPISAIETAVVETHAAWTAVPTQTPYPTHTPQPTHTAFPTFTPLPTYTPLPTIEVTTIVERLVTATLPPDFVELYRFNGRTRSSTDPFVLISGTTRIKWRYLGNGSFAAYLKRLDTDLEELLENTVGPSEGQQVLNLEPSDQYLIDGTSARGDWEFIVEMRP